MKQRFEANKNNLWTHLAMIMNEALGKEGKYARCLAGAPPKKTQKVKERDEAIHRIVQNYDDYDRLEFLRAIAYRFHLN